jgi:choice-of-anchor B domain-containing protein
MRKYWVVAIAALLGGFGTSSGQLNMTLLGTKTYANELNDIWGYVDSLGNEYALVGVQDGISIVDVTDPANPTEIWWFNGPFTTWRDLKVWNDHCYVTNESSQGLFIIDLSGLPDTTAPATNWYAGSTYPWGSAHNIYIDEKGVAYIMGADFGVGGAILLDVDTDPMNPIELGVFDDYYLHDGMARGDTLWGGAIYNGFFTAVDVSNKSNPVVLATHNTPSSFTHNCWIDDAGKYVYTTDEKSKAYIAAYDVSDVGNITEVDRIRSNPGTGVIPHNTHFYNDYVITSYYRDGVTVHDVTYPDNMIEVANYDTYAGSGNGFNGAWGVYPWLPSGNIIVSNIEDGLSVHGITYVRGCYLQGDVTDLFTSNPIPNATISILSNSITASTDLAGSYKSGLATANTYQVEFSAPGYISDTLPAVLSNGSVTVLDAQLSSLPSFALNGMVEETNTGNPIANAEVSITNNDFTFNLTTDGAGNFTIPAFYAGSYDITVGKWNYITDCSNSMLIDTATGNLLIQLDSGYYDDFSLDFGWSVTSSAAAGLWEMGEPLGTDYNGEFANPELDVQTDCSDQAYVTGNTGEGVGDDDVDDGITTLTSPGMNLITYTDPYVEYYRWFFNDGGFGAVDDTLKISITDGTNSAVVEEVTAPSGASSWVYNSFRVLDYIPLSATIRLVVEASDKASSGHLVEAGLDMFQAFDSIVVSSPDFRIDRMYLAAFPNPFSGALDITYDLDLNGQGGADILLLDIAGRIVFSQSIDQQAGTLRLENQLGKGIYMLQLISRGEVLRTIKVVKA